MTNFAILTLDLGAVSALAPKNVARVHRLHQAWRRVGRRLRALLGQHMRLGRVGGAARAL